MSEVTKSGNAIVYRDDILVATETVDVHLNTLKKIFELLVLNKLELGLKKCSFLSTEIEYLGYRITKEGIQLTERGIAAVQAFPEPRTIKEVHSFLDLASYFRKFIDKFAIIAKPLYSLRLKKY